MEQQICVVCKQPIDSILVVNTDKGPVHPGQCQAYIEQMPVTESSEEFITETELLL